MRGAGVTKKRQVIRESLQSPDFLPDVALLKQIGIAELLPTDIEAGINQFTGSKQVKH